MPTIDFETYAGFIPQQETDTELLAQRIEALAVQYSQDLRQAETRAEILQEFGMRWISSEPQQPGAPFKKGDMVRLRLEYYNTLFTYRQRYKVHGVSHTAQHIYLTGDNGFTIWQPWDWFELVSNKSGFALWFQKHGLK